MLSFRLFLEEVFGNQVIAYHRTRDFENIAKIGETGFKIGSGSAFGSGIYATYDFNSQLDPAMLDYGEHIIKANYHLSNYLILEKDVQRRVFGREISPKEQFDAKMPKNSEPKYIRVKDFIANPIEHWINTTSLVKSLNLDYNKIYILSKELASIIMNNIAQKFKIQIDGKVSFNHLQTIVANFDKYLPNLTELHGIIPFIPEPELVKFSNDIKNLIAPKIKMGMSNLEIKNNEDDIWNHISSDIIASNLLRNFPNIRNYFSGMVLTSHDGKVVVAYNPHSVIPIAHLQVSDNSPLLGQELTDQEVKALPWIPYGKDVLHKGVKRKHTPYVPEEPIDKYA